MMLQLPVTKQGSFAIINFTDRVATFDSGQRCVFLSRKKHPEELLRHKLVVHKVRLWPEFDHMLIDERYDSVEAMLTLQVKGVKVEPNHVDMMRVLGCTQKGDGQRYNAYFPDGGEHTSAAGAAASGGGDPHAHSSDSHTDFSSAADTIPTPHSTQDVNSVGQLPPVAPIPGEHRGKEQSWVLRCSSVDELAKLVKAFRLLQTTEASREAAAEYGGAAADDLTESALPAIYGDVDSIRAKVKHSNGRW